MRVIKSTIIRKVNAVIIFRNGTSLEEKDMWKIKGNPNNNNHLKKVFKFVFEIDFIAK